MDECDYGWKVALVVVGYRKVCVHTFPAHRHFLSAFLYFYPVVTPCVFSCRVWVVELNCDEALSLYESFLESHSSDLTVAGTIPNTKDLGKSATLNYAIGSASGKSLPSRCSWSPLRCISSSPVTSILHLPDNPIA